MAMPSVGALTTVRLGLGFSCAGTLFGGGRPTPVPMGAPNAGGRGGGAARFAFSREVFAAAAPAAMASASEASSRRAASRASISRCCSSSSSRGDFVLIPRAKNPRPRSADEAAALSRTAGAGANRRPRER